MRIFFALSLSEKTKGFIDKMNQSLSINAKKGRFTTKDNLHITLEFIGEVEESEIPFYLAIMKQLNGVNQLLTTSGFQFFHHHHSGDILTLKIDQNQSLIDVSNQLRNQLDSNQIPYQKQVFLPHITLGRKVIIDDVYLKQVSIDFPLSIEIDEVVLMESVRINEQLVYRKI